MNYDHLNNTGALVQVRAILDGTQAVEFSLQTKIERYDLFAALSYDSPTTPCQNLIKVCC